MQHQSEQSKSIPLLLRDKKPSVLQSRGDGQFYGYADEKMGNVIALKFIAASGEQKAIHYHDVCSPMEFNGDNEIRLSTTRVAIIIKGANLERLFDRIIQHQVMWIKEPDGSFMQVGEDKVEITALIFDPIQ